MLRPFSLLAAGAFVVTFGAVQVDAHGTLKVPPPEDIPGKSSMNWVVTLQPAWPWEGSGTWKGGDQAGMYAKLSKKNGFPTLRSFMEDKGAVCGFTNPNATPRPVPSTNYAEFLGNGGGGFTHQGPCEIWLDDKQVLHNDNCEKAYPVKGSDPAKLPVDYSSCTGKCMLRFYWLGFQNEDWQVYKNCIPLVRQGGALSASKNTTVATPQPTPKATPKATPTATPTTTPKSTPKTTPKATPEAASEATTPKATPKTTPKTTPKATPATTPKATPEPSSRPSCSKKAKRRLSA